MITIHIIMGSTRPGRQSEAIAQWVHALAVARSDKDVTYEVIDLRDFPLPFYDEPVGAMMLGQVGYTNEVAKKWAKKVSEADGYILVTPEYNHGYSAVLKNALDYVYDGWINKAVGFVSYGAFAGGSRAAEQLRQVVAELQMHDIRQQVLIPAVWEKVKKGKVIDEGGHLAHSVNALLDQLIPHTKSFQSLRHASLHK